MKKWLLLLLFPLMANAVSPIVSGTLASNTSGTECELPDGQGLLILGGTFATSTITVQVRDEDGTSWVDTDLTYIAADTVPLFFGAGVWVRVKMTGYSSDSVTYELRPHYARVLTGDDEGLWEDTRTVDGH